ncbi:MAG: thioredoxin [Patescibacteria group bacterium]|nr:thioredoxin [Patescibacteria group bacterium]
MVEHFNDTDFAEKAIEASKTKPVLIDFYANWCGPCQIQAPILEDVVDEIGDKAVIAKVNVEEAIAVAQEFGVMSIPTLIIFKNGQAVKKFNGLQLADDLIAELQEQMK